MHGICERAGDQLGSPRNIAAGIHTAIAKITGEQENGRGGGEEAPPQRDMTQVRRFRGGEDEVPPQFGSVHKYFAKRCERRALRIKEFGIIHHDNNRCGWRRHLHIVIGAGNWRAAGGEHLGKSLHIRASLRSSSVTSRDEFGRDAGAQLTMRVNEKKTGWWRTLGHLVEEEAQCGSFPRSCLPNNKNMPGGGKIEGGWPAVAGAHSQLQRIQRRAGRYTSRQELLVAEVRGELP